MNIYFIFTLALLYLEIFSRQTSGTKISQYDCGTSNRHCFDISDVKLDWNKASSNCKEQKGRLFQPLKDMIQYLALKTGGEYYWTEIHRMPNKNCSQTTDGIRFPDDSKDDSHSWKNSHPTDSMKCLGYDRQSDNLKSIECNDKHFAVCRIDEAICNAQVEEYEDSCPFLTIQPEKLTENTLRNLSNNISVTTGDYTQLYNNSSELIVTQVSANSMTEITTDRNVVQISRDPSEGSKTLLKVIPAHYENNTFIVTSNITTVYTSSSSSVVGLTIKFTDILFSVIDGGQCVHLTSDGHWSTEGVDTSYFNSKKCIVCIKKIQNIGTIAVGTFKISRYIRICLIVFTVIISFISLLFLLSSLVIFIASGMNFFSLDINILHFNNTLSLSLAYFSVVLFGLGFSLQDREIILSALFLLSFLWMNAFLSCLSVAISVFYTIWIVSINRTAKKLSKYLIPIGWGVSVIWSVPWTFLDFGVFKLLWLSFVPMVVILLFNITLLIASLIKVWLALRKQSSQQGELKRLRKVVKSGILLISAMILPFLAFVAIRLCISIDKGSDLDNNILAYLVTFLIISPIGIIYFILIPCQIKETIIRKNICRRRRMTVVQTAHSLHLNIARPKPKRKNHNTLIEHLIVQQTPDTIPDSVPSNDSAVFSDDSTQTVI